MARHWEYATEIVSSFRSFENFISRRDGATCYDSRLYWAHWDTVRWDKGWWTVWGTLRHSQVGHGMVDCMGHIETQSGGTCVGGLYGAHWDRSRWDINNNNSSTSFWIRNRNWRTYRPFDPFPAIPAHNYLNVFLVTLTLSPKVHSTTKQTTKIVK